MAVSLVQHRHTLHALNRLGPLTGDGQAQYSIPEVNEPNPLLPSRRPASDQSASSPLGLVREHADHGRHTAFIYLFIYPFVCVFQFVSMC